MESLIATNKAISQQLTLWGQQGSKVILGNLLVVPTQDAILYVEPVYMQSTNNPLPVFQKVVVATSGGQIVWGDTLEAALTALVSSSGQTPGASPTPGPTPGTSPSPSVTPTPAGSPTAGPSFTLNGTAQQLIAAANQHYEAAQKALRNGDLATYQKEMDIVGQILAQLQNVLGTPAPSGR
jgi:uncharacterized membrane protein (UPF0182 family)